MRIPFEPMWEQFKRVTKRNAAIVLFSQMPFGIDLIQSNRKMFRYEWVWHKSKAVGFFNANKMPLRAHENILVFYRRLPTYNPQYHTGKPYIKAGHEARKGGRVYNQQNGRETPLINDGTRYYPRDVLEINSINGQSKTEPQYHPTQKPVALMEFLVKTYTNRWETVLDATMGSGSTGVAAMNTGRRFVGFETNAEFFDIAQKRIDEAIAKREQSLF